MFRDSGWSYPTGTYTLIFEGDGEVFVDLDAVAGPFVSGGTYNFTVASSTNEGIILGISRSNVNDPVRNIQVLLPNTPMTYETDPFMTDYLAVIDPFTVIRFTEWAPVNMNSASTTDLDPTLWADRITTDYAFQSTEFGVAYEYIIDLSNKVDAAPWFSIPHRADDEYVRELATLILSRFDSNLDVYVEYSNEVWNFRDWPFSLQWQWAVDRGMELGLSTDEFIAGHRYNAKRSAEIFEIFEEVFGDDSDRLVNVLGSWVADAAMTDEILTSFSQAQINGVDVNPTGVEVDAIAIAPYFGGDVADVIFNAGTADTVTLTEILDALEATIAEDITANVAAQKTVADAHNVPLISYEGAQSLWTHDSTVRAHSVLMGKLNEANRQERMNDIYDTYFDAWFNAGGGLFMHYNTISLYDQWHSFGLMENQDQRSPGTPKYRAILDLVNEFLEGIRTFVGSP